MFYSFLCQGICLLMGNLSGVKEFKGHIAIITKFKLDLFSGIAFPFQWQSNPWC